MLKAQAIASRKASPMLSNVRAVARRAKWSCSSGVSVGHAGAPVNSRRGLCLLGVGAGSGAGAGVGAGARARLARLLALEPFCDVFFLAFLPACDVFFFDAFLPAAILAAKAPRRPIPRTAGTGAWTTAAGAGD
jgi:hypothetical protein